MTDREWDDKIAKSGGAKQKNNIKNIKAYLEEKGYSSEEIYSYLDNKNYFNPDVKGKDIKEHYQSMLTKNAADLDNDVQSTINGTSSSEDISSTEYLDKMQEMAYSNKSGLMTDYNSVGAQEQLQNMNNSIDQEQNVYNQSLAQSEMSAYSAIGNKQMELENQIAEARTKALKSGTTSAQLASQQLANMFAAQSGVAEIRSQYGSLEATANQGYAAKKTANMSNLYNILNTNQATLASTGAQNYAAAASYMATVNQQKAALQANANIVNANSSDYLKSLYGES
ncbi:MAG: hypothetical protein WCR97_04680 [Bacilli bacterium]